jgi:chorismate synthase
LQILAIGQPPGLGSHVDWMSRLDGRIGRAFLSVPAVKGIDIGDPSVYRLKSTEAQDEIVPDGAYPWITRRTSNRAGGLEGGCTDGEPVVVTARFKPVPTSDEPLNSVEIHTRRGTTTTPARHDVCPAIAAAVILESMLAIVLAEACLEKFGGDAIVDTTAAKEHYLSRLREQDERGKEEQVEPRLRKM